MARTADDLLGHVRLNPDDLLGSADEFGRPASAPPPNVHRVTEGGGGKINMIAGEAFDGASLWARELAAWLPPSQSADRDILPQKRMADARVRDMYRNDAYVMSGANLRRNEIVGGYYMLNAQPMTRILLGKHDEKWEEAFQEEVEEKFFLWAESDDCWADATRRLTFSGLVRQVMGMDVIYGEALALAEWSREDEFMRTHNTSIRLVDLDRLATPHTKFGDPKIIGGVQVDDRHIPQGYHIRKAHPTERFDPKSQEWEFVPIRKPWGRRQALHLFEAMRPGQTRGIAEMTTGLMEMRMMKDFRATVLQNAFVQATYAASIESDLDTKDIFARLGGGNLGDDDLFDTVSNYMGAYLKAVSDYAGDSKQFQLNGVRIPHLPPGSKLHMQPAGSGGPLGNEFEQSLLRYLAAILGVSYEELSKDYSKTNYSSAKAGKVDSGKFMLAKKRMVADRFASMVYRLWLEESLNKGLIEAGNYSKLPNFYEPGFAAAYSNAGWIGAGRGQIDELKETQAATLRVKYNHSTDEQEIARHGQDWRRVYRQRAREKKLREDLGIEIETDENQMNATTGATRDKTAKASHDVNTLTDDEIFNLSTADDPKEE